jgi:WD40 repeat protein
MTSFERFENRLPALLDDLAVPRPPDYADDLFARTKATRQRPGWTFLERWIPMSALTRRLAAVPNVPWRLGALVALLAIAALVAALVAGSMNNNRPAPYGPAGNGQIIFMDQTGAIVAGDPVAGTTRTLIAKGGSQPIFSLDGRRFAYTRSTGGPTNLFIADADGTHEVQLSAASFSTPSYVGWSSGGDRILVVDQSGRMLVFRTGQPGPATVLNDLVGVGPVEVGYGYNFSSTQAFRPPNGDEIVFVDPSVQSLMAVRPDGTSVRTLLEMTTSAVQYTSIGGADWSPDGSKLLVKMVLPDRPDHPQLFVLNADGTGLQRLGKNPLDQYNTAKWSPDGTRIGFQWWTVHADGNGQDFHGIGVLTLATGAVRDLGPVQLNGFTSWDWSPDGESILEVPGDGSGDMNIVNMATGRVTTTPWPVDSPITWQRVAP